MSLIYSLLWTVNRKGELIDVKLVTNYDIIFDMCKILSTKCVKICQFLVE